jgi:flavin reductase (DIM6/NTAB) family NADH-FMN oxidoreductase RutF
MALDPGFDSRTLRTALGRFSTGVTIITTVDRQGSPAGLTANPFNSLSLDPPLVLWSLRRNSPKLEPFAGNAHFAVNVLAEAQVDLSRRFASATDDKFAEGQWSAGAGGAPVLAGCVAVFECERVTQHDAGDHVLFIGRVLALSEAALPPLLFQAGHYRMLGEVL